ncbi:MAG: hypothetical protein HY560_00450 [Gemmatimonadetes bacterium]|nr:hypothetical protein [Gemmatimonadota bacterium]
MSGMKGSLLVIFGALFLMGANQCQEPTSSSSSSSTRYYVSANGCTGGDVNYSGYEYSTCNSWYRTAVSRKCTKILDNCR